MSVVTMVAIPLEMGTAPRVSVPSLNVTVPVGTVAEVVTVAVRVRLWPVASWVAEVLRLVLVLERTGGGGTTGSCVTVTVTATEVEAA